MTVGRVTAGHSIRSPCAASPSPSRSARSSAGCGGDDEPGRTVTAPANGALRVVAEEYSFDPSTIVLSGAGTLSVTLGTRARSRTT